MRIEGTIHPKGDGAGFNREAWCQLVGRRHEFRRHAPRQGRNPLTGKSMSIKATEDAAEVFVEDRLVGAVYWSMSEEPQVNVSVEPPAMPLVLEWAAALGGEFRPESR